METLVTIKVSIVLPLIMEVKDRILEKAAELFMQFGIRSVSMDDIATHLGISKKTIYQYYADKDELVDAVIDSHITGMQQDCTLCSREAADAVHEIFIMMERTLEQFANMNPMLLYDLEKFHFKTYQRFTEHKNSFLLKIIRKNIEWGISEELYRPEINVEVMARFRLESMMLAFNMTVFPPAKYNLMEVTKELILHFIYGLATIKGHKLVYKYYQRAQNTITKS